MLNYLITCADDTSDAFALLHSQRLIESSIVVLI